MIRTMTIPRRTRIVAALFVLVLVGPGIYAFDWGGSLTTTNDVQSVAEGSEDDAFVNSERLVLYLTGDLGATREYVTQLGVRFSSDGPTVAADLERFYLQNNLRPDSSSVVSLTTRLGRIYAADPTGEVFRHVIDGASLQLEGVWWNLSMRAGTTALVNKEFSNVAMSIRDNDDADDDDTYLGPARFVGLLRFGLPSVVAGQSFNLALVAQEDMRDPASVVQEGDLPDQISEPGGVIDTQYVLLTADGPIFGSFFYTFGYGLGLGRTLSLVEDEEAAGGQAYRYQPIRAHLVKLGLEYYLSDFYSSVVRAGVTVSTGDDDYASYTEGNTSGNSTMFIPISASGEGAVFGLQTGNATIAELSYSLKPLETAASPFLSEFQTVATWYSFFRTAGKGPVSVSDVDPTADAAYLGSEFDLAFRFRPYSDLGFGLTNGFFFGNGDALFDDADSFGWIVRLQASLSF